MLVERPPWDQGRHLATVRPGRSPSAQGLQEWAPPAFDIEAYKDRNVVERSFNTRKQWRGLATRYDKLAITYRGGVILAVIVTWIRALGETP
jgi:transposase